MAMESVAAHVTHARPGIPVAASFLARRVSAQAPATCANLGPGFDCLALALRLRNTFDLTLTPPSSGRRRVEVFGPPGNTHGLANKRENLFLFAFRTLCERQGVAMPAVRLRMQVNLPPGRGLGSSATAVVGGLIAANALLGDPLSQDELLDLAVTCEPGGHADNVAAALCGGLVVTGVRSGAGAMLCSRFPVPSDLRAVLFIPDLRMSTVRGRSLLPPTYSRADVTFNLGRVALLLAALQSGQYDLLTTAMDDRLHQPYRAQMFPALDALIAAARGAGAYGACLSGGGSSVLALAGAGAERVRAALDNAAREAGVCGHSVIADISRTGASATLLNEDDEFAGDDVDDAEAV